MSSSTFTKGADQLDQLSDINLDNPQVDQVLKYDGTQWVNSTVSGLGSDWELVLTQDLTSSGVSAVDFTSGIDSSAETYAFVFNDVRHSGSSGTGRQIDVRFSSNSGSSFDSGSSDYGWSTIRAVSALSLIRETADNKMRIFHNVNGGSSAGANGIVYLFKPSDTSSKTKILANCMSETNAIEVEINYSSAMRLSAGAVDAVRFIISADTFNEGSISLYKIK